MVIAINGMYLVSKATGIANVIINVVNMLDDYNVIIFSPKNILEENKSRIINKNVSYRIKSNSIIKKTVVWFFVDFPRMLKKEKYDILINPAVWSPLHKKKNTKNIVIVNDFVSKEFKNTMKFVNRIVSGFIEKKSIKNADYIWCISDYTKQKLINYYSKRKCNNIFVGCGPDPFVKKIELSVEEIEKIKIDNGITKKFLLFVGSLEPRKNLSFLLKVFKKFHEENDYQLVVVGAKGWGKTSIAEIVNSEGYPKEDVIFTGFITEDQLRILYNIASCFVSTSLNEGFGLPQVEAMRCECPVVTSHNSAMIEVVEEAGITVKEWNEDEWCKSIETALKNKEDIVLKQIEKAKLYDWINIKKRFIDYLEKNK